jgi:hypothetical protein
VSDEAKGAGICVMALCASPPEPRGACVIALDEQPTCKLVFRVSKLLDD